MLKFRIDFDLKEDKLDDKSIIKSYPNIPEQEKDLLPYGGFGGLLYLELDKKHVFTGIPRKFEEKYYIVDYLFPTFGQLIDIIPNLKGESKSFTVELYSSGRAIIINYIKNNQILISLDNRSKEGENINEFPLDILDFSPAVIDATDKYIERLININSNFKDNKFIKALIESKNKAKNHINTLWNS